MQNSREDTYIEFRVPDNDIFTGTLNIWKHVGYPAGVNAQREIGNTCTRNHVSLYPVSFSGVLFSGTIK